MYIFKLIEPTEADWKAIEGTYDGTVYKTKAWFDYLAFQRCKPFIVEVREGEEKIGFFVGERLRRGVWMLGAPLEGVGTGHQGLSMLQETSVNERIAIYKELAEWVFINRYAVWMQVEDWQIRMEDLEGSDLTYEGRDTSWIDLTADEETMFARMEKKSCRYKVNKATKEGVVIRETDDPEKHKKYIAIMKERAELMKQLTEELFRYSVIVSEESEMQTESVNVVQVLEDSIMGYFAALNEKGIVPEVQLTEEAVIRELNKEYLARIFSNLLNNALKYSDGDLLIKLSAEGVITFTNTANDLSAVEVEQLFDRFYTVEAAHHSTGLGLSIARTLVERMGGTITAEYTDSKLTIRIVL